MVLLIVDDDPEDVEIFCEAAKLVDPTINCISENNGSKALSILQTGVFPDIIFLDANMAIMNGKDTLREIRKNPEYDNIFTVMYSTTINPSEIEECRKIGADEFLMKPASFQELCRAIDSLIKKSGTG